MAEEPTYQVITSDLHKLPLCIINAHGIDALCAALGQWVVEGMLCEEEITTVKQKLIEAKAPNDGLLGMRVTEQFQCGDLIIHICFGE